MKRRLSLKGMLCLTFLLLIGLVSILSRPQMMRAETVVRTSYTQEQFIEKIAPIAQELSDAYGVPASLIIGQAALSSNYGTYVVAVNYHNLMALPAYEGRDSISLSTTRYLSNKLTTVTDRFAIYDSWKASLYDYLAILKSGKVWGKELYETLVTSTDYKISVKALNKAGFSPIADYEAKLIKLIEEKNLTRYDKN
ncbi:glycoside hydrolase family 73 protein [Streptococcus sp. sy018]|uniref:glycoside hydrolase family 73 protein n=1 Tax=Streptococcus sp. sy018 TaxID=2600147 RepID=UPI0011B38729|nr:glucosaminidase domain-containing protein [Streptococcus sp. sy018]TWS94092.1 hypothetical protein FRX52_05390 [Streptococcus sp. sy018]